MSLRQESRDKWICEFASGCVGHMNDSIEICATAEGLEIGYDTLAWSQIDAARQGNSGTTHEEILGLIEVAEHEAAHKDALPQEHPFGAMHTIWHLRDMINEYFALPESERRAYVESVRAKVRESTLSAR